MEEPNHSIRQVSQEELEEAQDAPNKHVYKPHYDTIFEPLPISHVAKIIDTIVQVTRQNMEKKHVDVVALFNEDDAVKAFAQMYQLIFMKITDPDFVKIPQNVDMIKHMLLLKAQVDNNNISLEDAQREVCTSTANALLNRAKS